MKVLNEYIEDFVLKTTHPKITYDELIEVFIVDLGGGAWCEVYGWNRAERAVEIANLMEGKNEKSP